MEALGKEMMPGPEDELPTVGAPPPALGETFERPGMQIGPYTLVQLIGEGGFGSVFLAEQSEPVKRRVALKVIKLGMDTRQVVARFEQERQALALMEHPGIARVLDAGITPKGGPYFVMELVQGEPITEYCDKHNLPIVERLELVAQICSAVQHAHSKGIIHRDLKPSNVLVTTQDGRPHAKVIDFGVAKAIATTPADSTRVTEQRQMVGTPEYMSPEQAEGSIDIDTRTDVYALGVLLYELLTGSTPFLSNSLRSATFGELQRIIREEDPPTPSARLSGSFPGKLASTLRGDLDWIVMKALEKDRQRRYDTASALGLDIRRHLAGEAVLAAPPSAAYRTHKLIRRHKTAFAAAAVIAAVLLLGVVGVAWQARIARAERDKAEVIADFMSATLEGVGPSVAKGRDATMLKEMMDAAAAKIAGGSLKDAPEAELGLRSTIGNTYKELALYDEAGKVLEPAVSLARSRYTRDHPAKAGAISDLAQLLNDRDDLDAAEPLFREALAMNQRLHPGDNANVATAMNDLASLLADRGDASGAEPIFRAALEMRKRLFHGDDAAVAESLNNLAALIRDRDPAQAESFFREALEMNKRLYPGDHPRVAAGLNNLSVLLGNRGDMAGAEALARETLEMRRRLYPGDHPYVATALSNLALLIQDRGDLVAPEPLFREALAIRARLYPQGHSSIGTDLANLGRLLVARGDEIGAEPVYRAAVAMYVESQGNDFWPTANARLGLARSLQALHRFGAAETELIEAERVFATADGAPPDAHADCVERMVALYEEWDKAEPGHGHEGSAAKWKASLAAEKSAGRETAGDGPHPVR